MRYQHRRLARAQSSAPSSLPQGGPQVLGATDPQSLMVVRAIDWGFLEQTFGAVWGATVLAHRLRLYLLCTKAPMRSMAARASGRTRAQTCQVCGIRGHISSST
jgi:hypothetical protein